MKRLRVLVLVHPELVPPDSLKGHTEQEINEWKTEYDVASTLREAGHEVRPLGVENELKPIRDEIESWKPDVVFNLLEQFHGEAVYDQNVASYLELLRMPYTGCNPRGLVLARGKDLSKKLLIYHRIPLPAFAVFPPRRKIRRPPRLAFPLIVKSLNEDASWGISQASVVDSDEKLTERVSFIHESIGTAAIAEQYIEGRELYVGVLGNERLRVFPIWELEFGTMPQGARLIATEKVKHDLQYQQRHNIEVGEAHLSHARPRRLCAHRFPPLRRWHSLLHRSQPQCRDCPQRGVRLGRQARRPRLSRSDPAHLGVGPQPRWRNGNPALSKQINAGQFVGG